MVTAVHCHGRSGGVVGRGGVSGGGGGVKVIAHGALDEDGVIHVVGGGWTSISNERKRG